MNEFSFFYKAFKHPNISFNDLVSQINELNINSGNELIINFFTKIIIVCQRAKQVNKKYILIYKNRIDNYLYVTLQSDLSY